MGTLEKFNVKMIGATADAIDKAIANCSAIVIRSACQPLTSNQDVDAGVVALDDIGLPAMFALVTLIYRRRRTAKQGRVHRIVEGIDASPPTKCDRRMVLRWKEFEWRWCATRRQCIIICSIETSIRWCAHGRSITIAPALTLTDKEYRTA